MRRAPLSLAVLLSVSCAGVFAACSSDDTNGIHGPVFGDASTDGLGPGDGLPGDDASAAGDGASGDDASADGPTDASGCSQGSVAVVGGGGSSRFTSLATGDGPFTSIAVVAATFGRRVAVQPFGGGFVAVGAGAPLQFVASSGVSFGAFASVGLGTSDEPDLAVVGNALHLVYLGASADASVDHKIFHGTYTTAWDSADDPVLSNATQDFAPRAASAAAVAGKLLLAEAGDDGNLYAHAWSTTWQTVDPVGAPATNTVVPRVVALDGASAGDAMIVYVRRVTSGGQDYKIASVVRGATTPGVWGAPVLVNDAAYTTEGLSALALSGGRVLLAWRGVDDMKPYYALWSGTAWSAPLPFFDSGQPTLVAKPELARGVCGDDAVAVYPESGAGAKVTRLRAGAWSLPRAVPSSSGATDVGIASHP